MKNKDGTGLGNPVQVGGIQALAGKINRIETPHSQRLFRIGHAGFQFFQSRQNLIQTLKTFPHLSVRAMTIEIPDIRKTPGSSFPDVRMGFDQSGYQHQIVEAIVDLARSPALQFLNRADSQNPAVAHSDRPCFRSRRAHGNHLSGGKNNIF